MSELYNRLKANNSKLPDRTGSQHALQPGEQKKTKQDGWRRKWLQTPRQLKTRQQEDKWRDRTDSRSCVGRRGCEKSQERGGVREGRWGVRVGESLHINWHSRLWSQKRDWGIETAPYSRSSSSYNSLYLPLLNLKEKTGIWKQKRRFS